MAFIVLRQQETTIQAIVNYEEGHVSLQMMDWVESIPLESIVVVQGLVKEPKEPIKSTMLHDVEIQVEQVSSRGVVVWRWRRRGWMLMVFLLPFLVGGVIVEGRCTLSQRLR